LAFSKLFSVMHSLCLFCGILLILYCVWQWFRCFFTAFTSLFHQHGFCIFLFFISLSGTSSSCVLVIMSENDWYISSIVWSSVGLFSIHSPNLCSVLFFHSCQSTLLSCQTFFGVPHVSSEHMLMSVSTLIWSDLIDSCVSLLQLVRWFWNYELINTRSITESDFLLVGWQSLTHIMFCLVSIFSISSPALFDYGFLHFWLLAFRSPAIISGV
jgi:hypothetical protein